MHRDYEDKPTISPKIPRLILAELNRLGVASQDALMSTGIQPKQIETGDRYLSYRQVSMLIGNARQLSDDPAIGLRIGCAATIDTWGLLGHAMMNSATEKSAVQLGIQYFSASPCLMDLRIDNVDEHSRIQFDSPVPHRGNLAFCVEVKMASIFTIFASILGEEKRPTRICLSYDEPTYSERYREIFRCDVDFNCEHNAMYIEPPTLRRLPHADATSVALYVKLVKQMAKNSTREENVVFQIRKTLLESPAQIPSIEDTSSRLGMSSRTLRRKLELQNTTFREIVTDVRLSLAEDFLVNSDLSIDRIAAITGYTETSNFRRAYKNWANETPGAIRKGAFEHHKTL